MPLRKTIKLNRHKEILSESVGMVNFDTTVPSGTVGILSSYLPEVYSGQPRRIERYNQYEFMDQDPIINRCLDTIAEFCTQMESNNGLPFYIDEVDQLDSPTVEVLNQYLHRWMERNDFEGRLFKIIRNILKYGDQFFIRDPKTLQWLWIDPAKVQSIIVNRVKGRTPEFYTIMGLDINLRTQVATKPPPAYMQTTGLVARTPGPITYSYPRTDASLSQFNPTDVVWVPAEHVIHLSMSDGMDNHWPFGISILESVFKTYKQKELLEDAVIIYRVQRAPARYVFYIDVGDMPIHRAQEFVRRMKKEIHQRRIPNRRDNAGALLDTTYNPLSILEDYFIPVGTDNRGSRVEVLEEGRNLGEIDDLLYFDRKLTRGLGVPIQYIPGASDENINFSDGRVGNAFIQEYRFNKYCKRIQSQIIGIFDTEFKRYLEHEDVSVDLSSFRLRFHEPQSFGKYRQIEIDTARVSIFTSIENLSYISKRFALEKYLGWTAEDIAKNEKMLVEEKGMDYYDFFEKLEDEKDKTVFDTSKGEFEENEEEDMEEMKTNLGPGTVGNEFVNQQNNIPPIS